MPTSPSPRVAANVPATAGAAGTPASPYYQTPLQSPRPAPAAAMGASPAQSPVRIVSGQQQQQQQQ
eukprot:CAMPEP_0206617254 /NCGR_PEP_ID=MMETSP0325_2-20121206/59492_1 /ASSEMBLY_ACC=CAM_ASM_000347 /TAXON_ID=2866 /ORGANISM="Crypthecodinium cohnii, Strain Seligo" /LENGTH=65 /DNA_ID=CAMNT_0054139135 /DNA_START=20 /DNA_END=214 /DNA_ORIENTATION=-